MSKYRSILITNTNTTAFNSGSIDVKALNIVNRHNAAIFVKFYDQPVATFQDTPIRTIQVAANSFYPATPTSIRDILFSTTSGLSIRAVTEAADNGNTAPTTLPIVEFEY